MTFAKATGILCITCLVAFSIPAYSQKKAPADTVIGKYIDGKKDGIWRTYNDKGIMIKKEKYKAGELIYYIIYNEKRKIIEVRDRKGRVTHYNPCNC